MSVCVIAIATDNDIGLKNLLFSLDSLGYENISIIKDENFDWKCKSEKYCNEIIRLKNDFDLFCLVDASNTFFVGKPNDLIREFNFYDADIIIPKDKYFGYNFDIIVGKGNSLMQMLKFNKNEIIRNLDLDTKLQIDTECYICAIISNAVDWHYNLANKKMYCNHIEGNPIIMYFPGLDSSNYNYLLSLIYPDSNFKKYDNILHHANKKFDNLFYMTLLIISIILLGMRKIIL